MTNPVSKLRRIDELDLLRGTFILTIIIDHLQRWPSPLMFATGQGRLWASAAEGFFIISGLLIGYIRGYRSREQPLKTVSQKLIKRAAMLYIWSVIVTIVVVGLTKWLPVQQMELIPTYPDGAAATGWWHFLAAVISQAYVSDWIYFLRLYWIMLLVAPLVVWLLRRRLAWLVAILSVAIYAVSLRYLEPEAAFQWQVLFFVPAVFGYYLEPILDWLRAHRVVWRAVATSLMLATAASFMTSFYWVHGWTYEFTLRFVDLPSYTATRAWLDPWFYNTPLAPGRVLLGFLWFGGALAFIHFIRPWLTKYAGWLLFTFGKLSLSAYILQAIILSVVQAFVPVSISPYYNFALAVVVVLTIWGLLKIPVVRKVLPA